MIQKLDALVFLQASYSARAGARGFKIHPLVVKYVRMYQWKASQKNLVIGVTGDCFREVFYNPQAIGSVLQAVLDNLVNYAPASSNAIVNFDVVGNRVDTTFSSLGAQIEDKELRSTSIPGFRAQAARAIEQTGQGMGLAAAHQVSEVLGLGLDVA